MKRQQQGVALITAILLVAIATILAAKLTWDNQINMRRTEATLMQEQARLFALGAEAIAIDFLLGDETQYDHAGDDWYAQTNGEEFWIPIGIEEIDLGQMKGVLSDAQGKLNINNLVPPPGLNSLQPPVADPPSKEMFEQLFDSLQLDPSLVDNIIDWIDTNTVPENRGVEDGVYTALDPGYRTANSYMASISELRAVNGIDDETFNILLPHITAIPPSWCGGSTGPIPVNINFATAEVLAAIPENGAASLGDGWVEERGEEGWEDIGQIPQELADRADYVTIESKCIGLNVTVNVGVSVLTMYSLLDRSGNDQIVARVRAYGLD